MREIRMLRVMWRELETGSRPSLAGHEGGNPGYRQGLFYRVTAPALDPTNVAGVLQDPGIPCLQTGRGKTKHLSEGKVPGHHCQHHAQRFISDKAMAGVGLDRFRREEPFSVIGVIIASPGAFFGFGASSR